MFELSIVNCDQYEGDTVVITKFYNTKTRALDALQILMKTNLFKTLLKVDELIANFETRKQKVLNKHIKQYQKTLDKFDP